MYITFKGFLYSLKKFILPAIVLTLIFAVLGAGVAFSKTEPNETGENTFSEEHIASISYLISLPDGDSLEESIAAEKATVPTVAVLLGNPSCRIDVLELLKARYQDEPSSPNEAPDSAETPQGDETTPPAEPDKTDKVSLEELFGKKKGTELTYTVLNGYLTTSIAEGTPVLNLSVTAKNKELAKVVLECYGEYLCTTAMEYIGSGATSTPIGEIIIETRISGGMQSITPEGSVYEAMMKYAIMFAFVGAVISVLCIGVIEFFNPTMVYAKDFLDFEVVLYGENCTSRRYKRNFAEDALLREIQKNAYDNIVVVGTLKGASAAAQRAAIANTLSERSGVAVTVADDVLTDFSQFEKLKAADAVIVVERKGKTTKGRFEKLISLIKDYNIDILGGVSL